MADPAALVSDAPAGAARERRLTVATYNVHRCYGAGGRYDPDRVLEVLREIDPDVIGLQEVDTRLEGREGVNQLDFLSERMGMAAVAGPNIIEHRGHYGNALLTRLPVLRVRRHDLSVDRREPRGVIEVDLAFEAAASAPALRVLVTHLGLRQAERTNQGRRLLDIVDRRAGLPTILLGDINEWWPKSRLLARLRRRLGRSAAPRTYPAGFPVLALDRIWVGDGPRILSARAQATPAARRASDHLPAVARIATSSF